MKFTCDSCGAQYMIGDDKLGKRGVKVRCKKCSYVIIVRPPGYVAEKKPTRVFTEQEQEDGTDVDLERDVGAGVGPATSMNDMDEPLTRVGHPMPEPESAPTYAGEIRADEDLSLDPMPPRTDLLRELAGMNAPEDDRDEAATAAFPVLEQSPAEEISRIEGPVSDFSSPMSVEGSSFESRGIPSISADAESENEELTSVDSLSRFRGSGAAASAPAHAATASDASESAFGGADLGRGDPPAEGFDEPAPGVEDARTRLIGHDGMRATDPREALSFDDAMVSAKISALDKDELDDMQSSLNDSLSDESWGSRVDSTDDEPVGDVRAPAKQNNMSALSRLAAAAQEEQAGEGGAGPSSVPAYGGSAAVAASLARLGIAQDAPVPQIDAPLDFELTNAFDQMFGAAAEEAEVSAGFAGGPESPPNEVFRSAYSDNGDRKQTRVFDLEAMKQVQAEQDLAERAANGHSLPTASAGKSSDGHEWYVAINDEQIGPMSFSDVRARWDLGDVGPASLCWRVGMPDWTAIREVKELEALGDMDDRARTVVAKVDAPKEDTDEAIARAPHSIAMPPEEDTKVPKPRAPSERPDTEEPSWRPSAASALASLAAQELGSLDEKPKKGDDAVGRALPATSDALEKLLASAGAETTSPGASPFGAAEQSSSKVRPLPKGIDVASSVSLRDPVISRQKSNHLIPVAIIGGFLLGAIILAVALRSPRPDPVAAQPPPEEHVEKAPPIQPPTPPTQAQTPPEGQQSPPQGQAAQGTPPTTAPNGAPSGANPAPGGAPEMAPAQAEPANPVQGQTAAAAQTNEPTPPSAGTMPVEEVKHSERGARRNPREGSRAAREPREDPREARAAAERERKREPEPESPPATVEDELLGPKKRRVVEDASSNDLPKQLEDSDILGELRRNKAAIQACRQKQQQADPALEGTLTVNFVIEGSGRTKHWEVEPAKFKSSVVGKCVVEAVKKWTFPRFSGRPMPVDFPVRIGGG